MSLMMLVLAGCTSLPEQEATWMQGAWYRWVDFNHRLSYVHLSVDGDTLDAGIVGGTSTSDQTPDLGDECDSNSCKEFPLSDDAEIRVGWGRITTEAVGLGSGSAELVVGADGASTTVSVELPKGSSGDVTALIRGLVIDTDEPLDGAAACYRPDYGWHPRRIQASIDGVVLSGTTAEVDVSAVFAAGSTQDPDRVCVDEVYERARIAVAVDVLVVAGHEGVEDEVVNSEATYPFSGNQFQPEKQEEVAPSALGLSGEGAMLGWASVDFAFNPGNEDERGVYLRTWGFEITDDGAAGLATNYSPITQLHDMAYTFEGTARAIQVTGTLAHGQVEQTIPVQLDLDERPVVHAISLE